MDTLMKPIRCALAEKYVPVFQDQAELYIFVRNLGHGMAGDAQLVLHVQSGSHEYRVRKAFKNMAELGEFHAGEVAALQILQTNPQPNIVKFHGSSPGLVYLDFCNGGDLSKVKNAPPSMIYELVLQLTRAIMFMSAHGVTHNDLHGGNVFVDYAGGVRSKSPRFCVGDFSLSTLAAPGEYEYPKADIADVLDLVNKIRRDQKDDAFMRALIRELEILAEEEHSLDNLLNLAGGFTKAFPIGNGDYQCLPKTVDPEITYYDSVQACLDGNQGIRVPFQIAKVTVDSNGDFKHVCKVHEKMYDLGADI